MTNIILCVAMDEERRILKDLLSESGFPLLREDNDADYFSLDVNSREFIGGLVLLETGIGKLNAASCLSKFLSDNKTKYPLVVNVGFAAGLGYEIGDIVTPSQVVDFDFDKKRNFTSFVEHLSCREPFYFKDRAILATSDNFVTEDLIKERKDFIEENRVTVFDMEAFGIAKTCKVFGKRLVCIKCISDVPGKDNLNDFNEFIRRAGPKLFNKVIEIIKRNSL